MDRRLLWLTTAGVGAVGTLMTSFGPAVAVLFLLLAVPLIVRGDHVIGLSGLLVGFGALWSLLIARQIASSGVSDHAGFWIAVGGLPLLLGCALLVPGAVRSMRPRGTPTADHAGSTRSRDNR